jgi:SAM-dependent methyltransferase
VYDTLAAAYDWLVPEALLTPEGSAAAFAMVTDELPARARVLDCACGTGTLAVGLALRGFEVSASDASAAMVARTRELAAARGVHVEAAERSWEALEDGPFDAVLCVGNSLTHAAGRDGRRAALAAMRRVLRDGGLVAITSRTWERPLQDGEDVVERGGRRARVRRAWHPPEREGGPHVLEVSVTVDDETWSERLDYWPFSHEELDADLRAAGLEPASSTWDPEVDRYLVTSRANSSNASR